MNSMDRPYHSPIRAEQAGLTRRRIIDAAHQAFLDDGYSATTIAGIAGAAGVSAQTIYNTFGTKPALLKGVHDVVLIGDDEPIPMSRRPEVIAMYQLTDPREFLHGYAALGRRLADRIGPLMLAIMAGAAAGDAELAEHLATTDRERLAGTLMVVRRVEELGALRPELTVERARDRIWALNSLEFWELLTRRRRWSGDAYQEWIGDALCEAVLAPARPARNRSRSV
ncbi:TetR/AcrR family transcriptional regulator [Microlunatus speluncae]|uniref:TetR/AcrR family transcriptional regulator n=1 Tax=Microlunatus speluncae TaxID=2594267 RepID=UPI0012667FD3|nr:TetR/AcrR family transcriptional regulator [Microlunatus speluncae]